MEIEKPGTFDEDFTFDEEPKAILDREIRQLRNKQVPLVKVLWQHHGMEEATWEPESTMRVQYPQLFSSDNFEDEIYFMGEENCNTPKYTLVVSIQEIQVQEDFTFDEEPKAILDHEIRQLRNKQVPLVKVLWQHHGMEEATWEPESTMRVQYPQLFSSGNFEDEIYFMGGGGGGWRIVTPPKYTLVVFNVFRVFCRHKLNIS